MAFAFQLGRDASEALGRDEGEEQVDAEGQRDGAAKDEVEHEDQLRSAQRT
uniref:Uncharacterized protein n=1 Tax=Aureimonas frigidaquae TaxID=424757 RepID=A0A0P0Z4G4_9HYPH|nr:hypothetical protein [Aureimonas frigidaquae]BAT28995.1 hypothetical protein [Aureimonas frigidaquae]